MSSFSCLFVYVVSAYLLTCLLVCLNIITTNYYYIFSSFNSNNMIYIFIFITNCVN